ncbi:MAG: LLM class flavin-dependent oxidoreductase [Dehalococcoidia bacterium]|nr:LLM class flavin-dependent oxidoreductase [Dehalococcoidia bacterium]
MKLDVFYEFCQGSDEPGADCRLYDEVLEQAAVADAAGFNCFWSVEHHGATPFSHMSAPEQFLTAVAMRTKRLRVGHAAALTPYKTNNPIRLAERAATLDNLSHGRLEMGLARSTPREWHVMDAREEDTRPMFEESLRLLPRIWTEPVFSYESEYITVPPVTIVPRVLQQPHPPLWVAATNPESVEWAGHAGVGMLGLTLVQPLEQLADRVRLYRDAIKDAEPVGKAVNNRTAAFTYVYCAESEREAIEDGAPEAAAWYLEKIFSYYRGQTRPQSVGALAAAQHVLADDHTPAGLLARIAMGEPIDMELFHEVFKKENQYIIGTPEQVVAQMKEYEATGLDQLMCFVQGGPSLSHEKIVKSLKLMGEKVLPHFDH